MKRRHTPSHSHARRRQRRRHVRAVLASAMLFAPHAARVPMKSESLRPATSLSEADTDADVPLVPEITVTTEYFVPANLAFGDLILAAAEEHDVDPSLVRCVIRAESGFNPIAVSSVGAQGLMQLMPELSEELGVTDPFDPKQNISAGVRYLKWLLDRHNGNESLALASYNAGPGAVDEHAGIPPFAETQQYVRTISKWLAKERGVAVQPAPEQPPPQQEPQDEPEDK